MSVTPHPIETESFVAYIEAHPGRTIDELAAFYGVEAPAVRSAIARVNEELGSFARLQIKGDAVLLSIADQDGFREWRCASGASLWPAVPSTREGRISFLVSDLLSRDDWVTVETLADALYCSRRTIAYDLQGVEEYLNLFGLELERRARRGVRVSGTEVKRRICLANNTLDRMAGDGDLRDAGIDASKDSGIVHHNFELDRISACVDAVVEDGGFAINSVAYQNLLVHIAIAISRIRSGCYAAGENLDLEQIRADASWNVANAIADGISQEFSVDLPETEIAYIAIHLAGKRAQLPGDPTGLNEGKLAISDAAWNVAERMVAEADRAFSLNLSGDLDLLMSLARHIGPLSVRLRYRMRLENPLLDDIRSRYPFAFACALEAARVLYEAFGSPVSDDETGYLALSFALALERRRVAQERPKSVLIVCASGMGSARLLAMRCREEFGPQLGAIQTCDVSQVAGYDFSDIDYVFTTVPLPVEVPVPVREVGFFLDGSDVRGVRELLRTSERETAEESPWFSRSLFFPHLALETQDDVIDFLCERAREQMPVADDLADLVRGREKSASTAYGNRVAMPHPLKTASPRTFACVGVLDRAVDWAGKPVRVVLLVVVSNDIDEDLHPFYQALLSFTASEAAVTRLLDDQRFEVLLDQMGSAAGEKDEEKEVKQ